MPVGTTAAIMGIMGAAGVGASIFGANKQANAAKDAAAVQAASAAAAAQDARQAGQLSGGRIEAAIPQTNQMVADATQQANDALMASRGRNELAIAPYQEAGNKAVSDLSALSNGPAFSFEGKDLVNDPGYQFALQQGQQALERSAAARGSALGGAALKMTDRYATDYAGTKFNEAFQRALDTYKTNASTKLATLTPLINAGTTANQQRLTGDLSTTGAIADNTVGSGKFQASNEMAGINAENTSALQAAQIAGNASTSGANAQAAGIVGSANAWANGLSGATNSGMQAALLGLLSQSRNSRIPNTGGLA